MINKRPKNPFHMSPERLIEKIGHYTSQLMGLEIIKQRSNPETTSSNYDYKADIWSVGLTLAETIIGEYPYGKHLRHPSNSMALEKTIKQGQVPEISNRDLYLRHYQEKSEECLALFDFVARCLIKNVDQTMNDTCNRPVYSNDDMDVEVRLGRRHTCTYPSNNILRYSPRPTKSPKPTVTPRHLKKIQDNNNYALQPIPVRPSYAELKATKFYQLSKSAYQENLSKYSEIDQITPSRQSSCSSTASDCLPQSSSYHYSQDILEDQSGEFGPGQVVNTLLDPKVGIGFEEVAVGQGGSPPQKSPHPGKAPECLKAFFSKIFRQIDRNGLTAAEKR